LREHGELTVELGGGEHAFDLCPDGAGIKIECRQLGITEQAFLERLGERLGAPLTPEKVGQGVVALLTDQAYQVGNAFRFSGKGIESLN